MTKKPKRIERFDSKGNRTYVKIGDFWAKWLYGKNGNLVYYENSRGFHEMWKYKNSKQIHYENSEG